MSSAVVQATFHKFCEHFATEMYDEHIFLPSDENGELDRVMEQYEKLGFPGAMGSTDVTISGGVGAPTIKPVRTLERKGSLRSGTR